MLTGQRFCRGRSAWALAAGVLVGASFLTKPETFVAAGAAWAACLVLSIPSRGLAQSARGLPLSLAGALLPIGMAWLRLRSDLPPDQARHALLGAWPYSFDERVRSLPFYASMSGLLHPQAYALALLRSAGRYALYGGAWLGLLFACQRSPRLASLRPGPRIALLALFGLVGHTLFLRSIPWPSLARPLPLVAAGTLLVATWGAVRNSALAQSPGPSPSPARAEAKARLLLRASLAALALALLAKVVLNVRLYHYGFVLALPASLLAIGLSVEALPRALGRRLPAAALRTIAVTFWIALAGSFVLRTAQNAGERSTTFGGGSDRLRVSPALGEPLQAALTFLEPRLTAQDSLLVLPEGVMLNYQLRAKSPSPHINFMPPELLFWDEGAILATLQASPPTYVALVHKDTSEYGFPSFGRDYGPALYAWVRASYRPLKTFGAVPFTSSAFGVAIYGRE